MRLDLPQLLKHALSRASVVSALLGLSAAFLPASTQAAGTETRPAENLADGDFVAGRRAISQKNWKVAIVQFEKVVKREPGNADAHNWLGFAYRHENRLDDSFRHYREALKLDPRHKGAHEYIGQAYLKANQPERANEHLAELERICGKNCEEYQDLARAVAAFNKQGK